MTSIPGPGVVDQGKQLLRAARMRLAVIEVRQVDRALAPPPDLDRLAERVQEAVTEA